MTHGQTSVRYKRHLIAATLRARAKAYEGSSDPDEQQYHKQLLRVAHSIESQQRLTDSDREFAISWFEDVLDTHHLSSKADRADVKLALEALELFELVEP